MSTFHVEDFFSTTLDGGINDSVTTMVLTEVPTSFPCYLVLEPNDTTNREIVKVTDITGTTCTITRGIGTTSASAHTNGVAVGMNPVSNLWSDLDDLLTGTSTGHSHNGTDSKLLDDTGIRLRNNNYLIARNAAGDGNINLAKINADDKIEFAGEVYIDITNKRLGIGTSSPSNPLHIVATTNQARLDNGTNYGLMSVDNSSGAQIWNLDSGDLSNNASLIRMFRNTTTTGVVSFAIMAAGANFNHRLYGQGGDSYLCANNGDLYVKSTSHFFFDNTNKRLGINQATPLTSLHIRNDSYGELLLLQRSTDRFGRISLGGSGGNQTMIFELGATSSTTGILQLDTASGLYPSTDNSITCGKSGNRWSAVWAANGTIQTSDIRFKENIRDLEEAQTDFRVIRYNEKRDKTKQERIGLIAQDVQKVYPEVITTAEDGTLGINYAGLVPVLLQKINELEARLSKLEG
jgi:hypothetical protein